MKRILVLFVVFVLSVTLSSCATIKKGVELSGGRSEIQSIEIYNIEEAYYEGDISKMRQENEPCCVFDPKEHADLLDTIYSLEFEEEKVFFPIPMDGGYDYSGYVIAVVFLDGSYDIIAEKGQYSCSISDKGKTRHNYDHSNYCGEKLWADLIGEYVTE